jgi:hypothetical protein
VGNQGQDLWEQIYLIERGANYGWSIVEGTHKFNDEQKAGPTPISKPVAEHSHAEARAMTGGLIYNGSALPELKGAYIYADYSTGRIWGIRHDGKEVTWHKLIADSTLQITGFGTDSKGEMLICDHQPGDKGGFYRLVPTPPASSPTSRSTGWSMASSPTSRSHRSGATAPTRPGSSRCRRPRMRQARSCPRRSASRMPAAGISPMARCS